MTADNSTPCDSVKPKADSELQDTLSTKLPRRDFLKQAATIGASTLALSQLGLPAMAREKKPALSAVPDNHPLHPYDPAAVITAKTFPNLASVTGISQNQLEKHLGLYHGYVRKINAIHKKLQAMNLDNADEASRFRPLHVEQTYMLNGAVLHEYYFENIGGETYPPEKAELLYPIIQKEFGSWDNYIAHLIKLGKSARGWAISAYNMRDHRIHNYCLDMHNDGVPMGVIPVLVMDVYEHAYMIDYETNRMAYIKAFMANVNWRVVEDRLKTMILHG
ncbi:MAG: Fe-Mn family superoxide dismutase [Cyanobacteria bacterium P01_H01_bin.74]